MTVHRESRWIDVVRVGRSAYRTCWALQRRLQAQRAAGEIGDVLLLTEHDPVITLGTTADTHHLLASTEQLNSKGIDVVNVDRGGDVTFHAPGQLVGYPILDLSNHKQDLHWYLRQLEQVVILTLAQWGMSASRSHGYTGVWVGEEKVCAIGINVRRWVTMHGFALNVTTDLSGFCHIIPCGIADRGVASMASLLGRPVAMDAVEDALVDAWNQVFQHTVREITFREFGIDAATFQRHTAECV